MNERAWTVSSAFLAAASRSFTQCPSRKVVGQVLCRNYGTWRRVTWSASAMGCTLRPSSVIARSGTAGRRAAALLELLPAPTRARRISPHLDRASGRGGCVRAVSARMRLGNWSSGSPSEPKSSLVVSRTATGPSSSSARTRRRDTVIADAPRPSRLACCPNSAASPGRPVSRHRSCNRSAMQSRFRASGAEYPRRRSSSALS